MKNALDNSTSLPCHLKFRIEKRSNKQQALREVRFNSYIISKFYSHKFAILYLSWETLLAYIKALKTIPTRIAGAIKF